MIDIERDLTNKEIRAYRRAIGLTQQELAEKLGTTRQTINRLENEGGKVNKVYSIGCQAIYEALVPENEREFRLKIARLGVNYADATEELINLVKNSYPEWDL